MSMCTAIVSSCKPEEEDSGPVANVTNTRQMRVPASFEYNTTSTITFDVSTSNIWGKEKIRVDFYDFKPNSGGEIICTRFLDGYGMASGIISMPTSTSTVYAVIKYPDGSSDMAEILITGNSFSHEFTGRKSTKKTVMASPNCTAGCSSVVANSSNIIEVKTEGIHCFTGIISKAITVSNMATARICGSGTFELTIKSGGKVEIVDGADVTISLLTVEADAEELVVFSNAKVSVENWATPNADITNYGKMDFTNLNINSNAHFENHGTLNVTGTGYYELNGTLTNYGSIVYNGNLTQSTGATISNYCSIQIAKQLKLNTAFNNYAFVQIGTTLFVNAGAKMNQHSGSFCLVKDVYLNGTIEGLGQTSLLKITDAISGNSQGTIKGNLQVCDLNGIEGAFSGDIISPAAEACDLYIPSSICYSEGNGNTSVLDSDFDGVADGLDFYPNDPVLSGVSYYPSTGGFATLMFEDLWPGKGDYDFNDLVISYCHRMVTNSDNLVVRVESKILVKAIGGSLKNGFGFQFNVGPSSVESVTGNLLTEGIISVASNGTEKGQGKATIIAFDNAYSTVSSNPGAGFVNTNTDAPVATVDTLTIITTFSSPVSFAALGEGPFNPFIFIDRDRGREVHMVNQEPTDLINEEYFGSASDDSNPETGRYFVTDKNHPWVLNFKGDISHMQEKKDIVEGYNYFATWAQSGGAQVKDWYEKHTAYTNSSKLY